jgi:hypothetical protein
LDGKITNACTGTALVMVTVFNFEFPLTQNFKAPLAKQEAIFR